MSHSEIKRFIVELLVAWAAALFLVPRDDRMARQEVARTTSRPRRRLPRSTVGVLAVVARALFASCESGRRRRELLGSRLVRQPGGGAAGAGILVGQHLLSHVGEGRRRRRVCAPGLAGRITTNFTANLSARSGGRRKPRYCDSAVRVRDAVPGRPGRRGHVVAYGRRDVSVDATLAAALGPFGFTVSGGRTNSVTGFGDLSQCSCALE